MNAFASAITNDATTIRTENGDKTFSTSLDANVDLFFKISAIRGRGAATAIDLFGKAYKEDADLASRILLHARDVREGSGERQVFRDLLVFLEKTDTDRFMRILNMVPELGRWDDLLVVQSERGKDRAVELFAEAIQNGNGLAAKWMPREHNKELRWFRNRVRDRIGMSGDEGRGAFRKMVTYLSNTVEQKMCAKEWDDIDFSHVPSVASARYSKAFWKRQTERYGNFIQKVTKDGNTSEVKINTKALFPYDVTKKSVDELTQNALWKNLPDYVPADTSYIAMVDLSSSMTSPVGTSGISCMDAAVSLGMYLAERNKSAFKNLAMSFTSSPAWIRVPETDSVRSKVNAMKAGPVGYDTNLDRAMDLILDTAIRNNVSQSDMPEFLIVLSDMEFNSGWTNDRNQKTSVAERSVEKFKRAGYKVPSIVWWNIQSRGQTTPVRFDTNGMVMVSGLSPSITKSVLLGDVNPRKAMLNTIMVERYNH